MMLVGTGRGTGQGRGIEIFFFSELTYNLPGEQCVSLGQLLWGLDLVDCGFWILVSGFK